MHANKLGEGTHCCQWKCSHHWQATSKDLTANLLPHPVWTGPVFTPDENLVCCSMVWKSDICIHECNFSLLWSFQSGVQFLSRGSLWRRSRYLPIKQNQKKELTNWWNSSEVFGQNPNYNQSDQIPNWHHCLSAFTFSRSHLPLESHSIPKRSDIKMTVTLLA